MIMVSCLLLSEGIAGAEDRYSEVVLGLQLDETSVDVILRDFIVAKGFMTIEQAERYVGDSIVQEMPYIPGRTTASIGWGKVRMFEVAERGQGQQRWLMVVRDAYDDETGWEFKPTT